MGTPRSRRFEELLIATDRWPLVLLEFPDRRIADSSLRDALAFHEELMVHAQRSGERIYVVTDLTRMTELAPASQRKYAGEWLQRTFALQQATTLGVANVSPSVIVRGLVTAIGWFQNIPVPTVWVATRKDAYAAAVRTFDEAGTRLRPELAASLTADGEPKPSRSPSGPGKPR